MREYIQILIWTMLFVVIIEMVFPDTDSKKYIKLILGLLIIYIVFSPFIKNSLFVGGDYNGYVMAYQDRLGDKIGAYEEVFGKQQEKLYEMRENQLEQEIKQVLEKNMDITVLEVEVEIDKELESLTPRNVTLVLAYGKNTEKSIVIGGNEISIPKIRLGEKDDSIALSQKNLEKQIKTCLNDFYNVDNFNIYITVQKNMYKGGK